MEAAASCIVASSPAALPLLPQENGERENQTATPADEKAQKVAGCAAMEVKDVYGKNDCENGAPAALRCIAMQAAAAGRVLQPGVLCTAQRTGIICTASNA